jgi:hypothetical protein
MKQFLSICCLLLTLTAKSNCTDSVLISELGMKKVFSSDIAEYYAQEKDSSFVHQLDSSLQANIQRLSNIFNYRIDTTIVIQIFPEFSYALSVCELDSTRRSALGCARYRKLNMVSPSAKGANEAYKYQDPLSIVVHEYSHVITFDIIGEDYRGKMRPWLREGIAFLCEPDPYYKKNQEAIDWVKNSINNEDAPKFKTLNNQYITVKYRGVWSAWLTEYLISKYGWPSVIEMITDYDNFPKNLGLNRRKLQKEWIQFIQKKIKLLPTKPKLN